jgi:hypothetical protein
VDGFLWIEGRMSGMINRGGLKVFPDEVEEVLRRHPAVRDAGVAPLHVNDAVDLLPPKTAGQLWKPVIAAVNGMACAGAFYLLGEVEFIIARAIWYAQELGHRQALDVARTLSMLGTDGKSMAAGQQEFRSERRGEWRLR